MSLYDILHAECNLGDVMLDSVIVYAECKLGDVVMEQDLIA